MKDVHVRMRCFVGASMQWWQSGMAGMAVETRQQDEDVDRLDDYDDSLITRLVLYTVYKHFPVHLKSLFPQCPLIWSETHVRRARMAPHILFSL